VPDSDMGFVSKEASDEGPIHLLFNRDSSGAINQINVAKLGIWNRASDYKPVVKKEMEHTPEQLTAFQGFYQLREDPTQFIQITVKDNKLLLNQLGDGNDIFFVPDSELTFFNNARPNFTLDFSKDKNGSVSQVVAFKRDVWIKQAELSITAALLKSYEGKYRSQDDPDNEIRIIATDSNLVVRQLWDQKERALQPLTNIYFNNQDRSFPLVIVLDQGKVVRVVLLTGEIFNRVPE
jgi:hypothetical protein